MLLVPVNKSAVSDKFTTKGKHAVADALIFKDGLVVQSKLTNLMILSTVNPFASSAATFNLIVSASFSLRLLINTVFAKSNRPLFSPFAPVINL